MKFNNKKIIFVIAAVLLLTVAVGTTLAYIIDDTDPVENTFVPSKVSTAVIENGSTDDDGSKEVPNVETKSNVKIKNTGDTEAWIRAAVVITWQDSQGNVYGRKPVEEDDYSLNLNVYKDTDPIGDSKWIKGADGFYYWPLPVKSDDEDAEKCYTGILISSCSYIGNAPDGYSLSVEILGSGIQSKPSDVFNEEWKSSGLVVDDSSSNRALITKTN